MANIVVEVREQTIIGSEKPTLDEVVLSVDDQVLFHLEQTDDNHWWMDIGGVAVNLFAKRAQVFGVWENDAAEHLRVVRDGKESA